MSVVAFEIDKHQGKICIVVGLGLVGTSIEKYLSYFYRCIGKVHFCTHQWNDSFAVYEVLRKQITAYPANVVDIIWCAGKGSFLSSDEEMSSEYNVFSKVMTNLQETERARNMEIWIDLFSSAGGIYEGNRYTNSIDNIAPKRPYAFWKLEQEKLLKVLNLKYRIYRASSVFGPWHQSEKSGLINRLITNTKNKLITQIYAGQNTLRDYIYSGDLARHVTSDIAKNRPPSTQLLVSGRSISISMLIKIIETLTRQRVKVSFSSQLKNESDMIFSHNLVPTHFVNTSLEEGIRIINSITTHPVSKKAVY